MANLNAYADEQLVGMYINGNDTAFDILMRRYESKVFTYIQYAVKNQEQAEDLFQDVFVRVIVHLRSGKYTENGKFSSLVMRIAHNLLVDHYRKSNDNSFISSDDEELNILNSTDLAVNENREQEMMQQQLMSEVRYLITQLPANQREVLMMRFYDDLSFKEIADMTNCSINTALGRMRYAIMNLKKMAKNIA